MTKNKYTYLGGGRLKCSQPSIQTIDKDELPSGQASHVLVGSSGSPFDMKLTTVSGRYPITKPNMANLPKCVHGFHKDCPKCP